MTETDTRPFPDDAPKAYGDLVSAVYDAHEFHRLHRNVSDEPVGGATWRSDDEEVKLMHYSTCGYWAVEASRLEYDDERERNIVYSKSNGAVDGLTQERAFQLADEYMAGETDLPDHDPQQNQSGQQTLSDVVARTDGDNNQPAAPDTNQGDN
jgi:hypothetical protein